MKKRNRTEYQRRYREANKERLLKDKKEYYQKNKGKILQRIKRGRNEKPWLEHYQMIKQRCENPHNKNYSKYGGRGIKVLMSNDGIKYLWNRDRAFEMKQAVIHRNDGDGHYIVSNCRFMEQSEHIKLHWRLRKAKLILPSEH